jgi:hypothetical protein
MPRQWDNIWRQGRWNQMRTTSDYFRSIKDDSLVNCKQKEEGNTAAEDPGTITGAFPSKAPECQMDWRYLKGVNPVFLIPLNQFKRMPILFCSNGLIDALDPLGSLDMHLRKKLRALLNGLLCHLVRALLPVLQVLDDGLHPPDCSIQKVAYGQLIGSTL